MILVKRHVLFVSVNQSRYMGHTRGSVNHIDKHSSDRDCKNQPRIIIYTTDQARGKAIQVSILTSKRD